MTDIAVQPIILSHVDLIIDEDNFAAHVSGVTLTPTYTTVPWKGLAPGASFNRAGAASWALALDFAQDWTTLNSLARYLFANDGQDKQLTFKPQAGDGLPSWSLTAQMLAGAIGGAVDTVPVSTVTLPVQGAPVPDWDDDPITPNPAE